jgi:MOSC domain-containing protein YiiM
METVERVTVNQHEGVHGDFRGAMRPGKFPRRQVSLIEAESWAAAMAELGRSGDDLVPWYQRRANLLIEDLRLPRSRGTIVAIGATLRIEITCECDPCSRMEEIAPGLKAVLMPDWRGGFLGRVIADGEIALGDEIRIIE